MKARVAAGRESLEARRRTNRLVDALFESLKIFAHAGGGLLAAAIAFRVFLFLVPCAFVLVMGLGLGADATGADIQEIAQKAGITGVAATAIQSSADASSVTRWVTLSVAFVALLMGARNLLKALWISHSLIWQVPPVKIRHPARVIFGFLGVFLGALLLLRVTNALRGLSMAAWLLAVAAYTLVPASVWLLCSARLFPRRPDVGWLGVVSGALVFGIGVQVLHVVTIVWVTRSMEAKSAAYGAIGAALTLLVWAYLVGLLVTVSAALNAAIAGVFGPRGSPREDDVRSSGRVDSDDTRGLTDNGAEGRRAR